MTGRPDLSEREAAMARLVAVTHEFAGLNEEDHVFRDPESGWLVKVKLLRDTEGTNGTSAPGLYQLTGAIVGPDGKALKRADDTLAVWDRRPHTWSEEGHVFRAPHVARDRRLRLCVLMTIAHEQTRQFHDGELGGYATVADFKARKAAEAAEDAAAEARAAEDRALAAADPVDL